MSGDASSLACLASSALLVALARLRRRRQSACLEPPACTCTIVDCGSGSSRFHRFSAASLFPTKLRARAGPLADALTDPLLADAFVDSVAEHAPVGRIIVAATAGVRRALLLGRVTQEDIDAFAARLRERAGHRAEVRVLTGAAEARAEWTSVRLALRGGGRREGASPGAEAGAEAGTGTGTGAGAGGAGGTGATAGEARGRTEGGGGATGTTQCSSHTSSPPPPSERSVSGMVSGGGASCQLFVKGPAGDRDTDMDTNTHTNTNTIKDTDSDTSTTTEEGTGYSILTDVLDPDGLVLRAASDAGLVGFTTLTAGLADFAAKIEARLISEMNSKGEGIREGTGEGTTAGGDSMVGTGNSACAAGGSTTGAGNNTSAGGGMPRGGGMPHGLRGTFVAIEWLASFIADVDPTGQHTKLGYGYNEFIRCGDLLAKLHQHTRSCLHRLRAHARLRPLGGRHLLESAAASDGLNGDISYLQRSHGRHYTTSAVASLVTPDFGDWRQYHPPVPSCRYDDRAPPAVLDFKGGVEAAHHVEGTAAVGKWDEVRKNMYVHFTVYSRTPRPYL